MKKTGQFLKVLCLLAALIVPAIAQTEQAGVFHESATGLTMRYPVELVLRDAQKAIDEGHVAVFGSMQIQAKEHELASRCTKPILLAELPDGQPKANSTSGPSDATLFLFEFIPTKECKKGFKYKDDEAVTRGIAQLAIQLPGATPLSPPLWFDFGQQKLHITFAAFGVNNTSPDQSHALITTAAIRYHGHILGWMMSASHLNTFKSDLSQFTQSELDKIALRLNQRPRKTLGFETPTDRLQASVASTP